MKYLAGLVVRIPAYNSEGPPCLADVEGIPDDSPTVSDYQELYVTLTEGRYTGSRVIRYAEECALVDLSELFGEPSP